MYIYIYISKMHIDHDDGRRSIKSTGMEPPMCDSTRFGLLGRGNESRCRDSRLRTGDLDRDAASVTTYILCEFVCVCVCVRV